MYMITTINEYKKSKLSDEDKEYLSDKIAKLISEEGYPRNQAVAIAYSYLDRKNKNKKK